jgi:hypothetical protein
MPAADHHQILQIRMKALAQFQKKFFLLGASWELRIAAAKRGNFIKGPRHYIDVPCGSIMRRRQGDWFHLQASSLVPPLGLSSVHRFEKFLYYSGETVTKLGSGSLKLMGQRVGVNRAFFDRFRVPAEIGRKFE